MVLKKSLSLNAVNDDEVILRQYKQLSGDVNSVSCKLVRVESVVLKKGHLGPNPVSSTYHGVTWRIISTLFQFPYL